MTSVAALARPTAPTEGPLAALSVAPLVGNTPLVEIRHVRDGVAPGVSMWAKLEGFNPGGSVKDRPALKMIEDGLACGRLVPGKTIMDSTSGNTGIALAMVGAALGYPVKLVMPGNVSLERKRVVAAFGAEVVYSDPLEGSDGAIRLCRSIFAEDPDRYFYPDQYNNPANVQAHYETTGAEIWSQTQGRVTHFVAALGTCGTFVGTGRRLRAEHARTRLIAVQPDGPYHALEGVKHLASTEMVPGIYDPYLADATIEVSSEEAFDMARCLARIEGLLVGISAAANVAAALRVARQLDQGVVVTILCDGAAKYL